MFGTFWKAIPEKSKVEILMVSVKYRSTVCAFMFKS